jgi:DNA polymerase-3 subunit beta
MLIKTPRTAVVKALSILNGTVAKSHVLPVLANVKIDFDGKLARLTASDTSIETTCIVEGIESEQPFSLTVRASKMAELYKTLDTEIINLNLDESTADGHMLIGKAGRMKFTLRTLPAKDFPCFQLGNSLASAVVKSSEFKAVLQRTIFCVSDDQQKPMLGGVLLNIEEGKCEAVSTDGYRMSKLPLALEPRQGCISRVIIPKKTALVLLRSLPENDDLIEISSYVGAIRFSMEKLSITSKLIQEKYPDYKKVLGSTNLPISVKMDRDTLLPAIQRGRSIVDASDKQCNLSITLQDGKMVFSTTSSSDDNSTEEIDINYVGERIESQYNTQFLLEAVSSFPAGEIDIGFQQNGEGNCPLYLMNPVLGMYQVVMNVRY